MNKMKYEVWQQGKKVKTVRVTANDNYEAVTKLSDRYPKAVFKFLSTKYYHKGKIKDE